MIFRNNRFEIEGSHPRHEELRFDRDEAGIRFIKSIRVAARLRKYADEATKKYIDRRIIRVTPWSGRIPHPKGLKPTPDQITAVKWAMSRSPASYLALDPGMGKAIIIALLINVIKPKLAVVLVPPHTVPNIKKELKKWARFAPGSNIKVFSDSMLHRKEARELATGCLTGTSAREGKILFVDEAQRYGLTMKGPSRRTEALLGKGNFVGQFEKVVYLSGTPIMNRLLELYPILRRSAPEVIDSMDYISYGMRYCGGYVDESGHYDFMKSSNADELFDKLKEKFMLRMRKSEKDFTKREEEIVYLGELGESTELSKMNRAGLRKYSPGKKPEPGKKKKKIPKEWQMRYLRLLGNRKANLALPLLHNEISKSKEKFIIFAHHKDVLKALDVGLACFGTLCISGKNSKEEKQGVVNMFQSDPAFQVLVASFTAAGTGLTMTAASQVRFVEFSWSPEVNRQAGDRAHRKGQKKDVHIKYLCFKNTLDSVILLTNLRKRETIDAL